MKPPKSSDSTVFAGMWAPSSAFTASRARDHGHQPLEQAKAVHHFFTEPAAAAVSLPLSNNAPAAAGRCCRCHHCHDARTTLLLACLALTVVTAGAAPAVGVNFAATKEGARICVRHAASWEA